MSLRWVPFQDTEYKAISEEEVKNLIGRTIEVKFSPHNIFKSRILQSNINEKYCYFTHPGGTKHTVSYYAVKVLDEKVDEQLLPAVDEEVEDYYNLYY